MGFEYVYKHKEANFGPPAERQAEGGTHITCEIILKKGNKYIALRRPEAIPGHEAPPHAKNNPKGLLYFCHNLMRYGESMEECAKRIVKEQTGVSVKRVKTVYIDSAVQDKDNQWAFTPHLIAEVDKIPMPGIYGNDITEVVTFTKDSIPEDWGWWTKKDVKEFLEEYD